MSSRGFLYSRVKKRVDVMRHGYKCMRKLQNDVNTVEKDLFELHGSMMELSSLLSTQCSDYSKKEDEEKGGIVHDTQLASQFAQITADAVQNVSLVFNTAVNGLDQTAKRFALTIMSSDVDTKLSAIQDQVEPISYTEAERRSITNAIEAYDDLRETLNACIKGLTDISRAVEIHRADAFKALDKPDPYLHQTTNVLSCVRQEFDDLDKNLKDQKEIFDGISKMSPLKKNENIRQDLLAVLRIVTDKVTVDPIMKFADELRKSKSIEDICALFKRSIECGNVADELLSYPSFTELINMIESYNEGSKDDHLHLRRGTLKLSELELGLLKQLETIENARAVVELAKKVPELEQAMHTPDDGWLETSLDGPSVFIHNLKELLNTIRVSSRDPNTGIESIDTVIVEQAFKQFVMLYDRQHQLHSDFNESKRICLLHKVPSSVLALGRKFLFHASVEYQGVMRKVVLEKELKSDCIKGHLLSDKKVKVEMHVFSDMICFSTGDRIEEWRMTQVRAAAKCKKTHNKDCKEHFIVRRYCAEVRTDVFYYFKVRGSDMEDADMPTVVGRINCAVKSHRNKNMLSRSYDSLCKERGLSCDDIPRPFIHAVAWILDNDLCMEMPFLTNPAQTERENMNILVENGYLPLYSSFVPESLLKRWLERIDGAAIPFKEEDWLVKDKDKKRFTLANKLNTLLSPGQRKLFAMIVALAHCVKRHHKFTKVRKASEIADEFAPAVLLLNKRDPRFEELNKKRKHVFADIFDLTADPTSFRSVFYSVFPGANPPPDAVDKLPEPSSPVVARVGIDPLVTLRRSQQYHGQVFNAIQRSADGHSQLGSPLRLISKKKDRKDRDDDEEDISDESDSDKKDDSEGHVGSSDSSISSFGSMSYSDHSLDSSC